MRRWQSMIWQAASALRGGQLREEMALCCGRSCNCAHDVSILMMAGVVAGLAFGWQPRAKVSMMSMRPPQHGQGRASIGGATCSAVAGSSGVASGLARFSNARALATFSARLPLAMSIERLTQPECLASRFKDLISPGVRDL